MIQCSIKSKVDCFVEPLRKALPMIAVKIHQMIQYELEVGADFFLIQQLNSPWLTAFDSHMKGLHIVKLPV